jgi:hypothetical protein
MTIKFLNKNMFRYINRILTKLPLKSNKVYGHFYCFGNNLNTLIGCPNEVIHLKNYYFLNE